MILPLAPTIPPAYRYAAAVVCDWLTLGLMDIREAVERIILLRDAGGEQAALAAVLEMAVRQWIDVRRTTAPQRDRGYGLRRRTLPVPMLPDSRRDALD